VATVKIVPGKREEYHGQVAWPQSPVPWSSRYTLPSRPTLSCCTRSGSLILVIRILAVAALIALLIPPLRVPRSDI